MTQNSLNQLNLIKSFKVYHGFKKLINKFNADISNVNENNLKIPFLIELNQKITNIYGIKFKCSTRGNVVQNIEKYLKNIDEYFTTIIKTKLEKFKINSSRQKFAEINEGFYAISGNIPNNTIHKFSQNIMYIKGCEAVIADNFIHSLYFNMILTMIKPGTFIVLKTNNSYSIIPYNFKDEIYLQMAKSIIPSDVFLSRNKLPYFIKQNVITHRVGRRLHPLGQLTTRGSWHFLTNIIIQLKPATDNIYFSSNIMGVDLYPESSVIDKKDHSYNNENHWTKEVNTISSI